MENTSLTMQEQEFNITILNSVKFEPVHSNEQSQAMFAKMHSITEQQVAATESGDFKKHDELQIELKAVASELFKNFKFIKPDGQ